MRKRDGSAFEFTPGDSHGIVQTNRRHDALKDCKISLFYEEIDPRRAYKIREASEPSRGVFAFIDFGSADGFGDLTVALLHEIALIVENEVDTAKISCGHSLPSK